MHSNHSTMGSGSTQRISARRAQDLSWKAIAADRMTVFKGLIGAKRSCRSAQKSRLFPLPCRKNRKSNFDLRFFMSLPRCFWSARSNHHCCGSPCDFRLVRRTFLSRLDSYRLSARRDGCGPGCTAAWEQTHAARGARSIL